MDYLEFFQLKEQPFSNTPSARYYYDSAQHNRALLRLGYAIDNMKGLAVVAGDIGSGKTTLARRILDSLPEEDYESTLLVIIHSQITASWLLRRIAYQLGVSKPANEKLQLLGQIYKRLVEIYRQGRKAVVIIDEAQMLQNREVMEEIRGMLNLEIPGRKLVTFVLFGLPNLNDCLALDEPLNQRVAVRCSLGPFSQDETISYILHRLRLAGGDLNLITDAAIVAVHKRTQGVPRLINTLCDNALFEAFVQKRRGVDVPVVESVALELGLVDKDQLSHEKGIYPSSRSRNQFDEIPQWLDIGDMGEEDAKPASDSNLTRPLGHRVDDFLDHMSLYEKEKPPRERAPSYSNEREGRGVQNTPDYTAGLLPTAKRESPGSQSVRDEPGFVDSNVGAQKLELRVANPENRRSLGEQRGYQASDADPRNDSRSGRNLHPSALDDIDSILEELEDKG